MKRFCVFISYRRSDAAGYARHLYSELGKRLDPSTIFFDRASIESGDLELIRSLSSSRSTCSDDDPPGLAGLRPLTPDSISKNGVQTSIRPRENAQPSYDDVD